MKNAKKKSKKAITPKSPKTVKVTKKSNICFDYIKGNHFRVIHVDGVHGGVAPNGRAIQMALFSERRAIPKRETYKLDEMKLGDRIGVEERDAIIREVEVEALIDLETAKRIIGWLERNIRQAEGLKNEMENK